MKPESTGIPQDTTFMCAANIEAPEQGLGGDKRTNAEALESPVPRIVLPSGIFDGVPEWSCRDKQIAVAQWLKTLPDEAFFRRGKPKRKPGKRYIHSTCGCWQCGFCHAVILRRAIVHHRRDIWQNI